MKFKIDWEKTGLSLFIMLFFGILVLVYIITYADLTETIEDQSIKVIALIVFSFSVVKLVSWIGYPTIYEGDKDAK